MSEEYGYLIDFKDFNWKNATNEDILNFGKTLDFPEPGISRKEAEILIKALDSTNGVPLTIFETGMCYGTTTRIFIAWTLKYGGAVYSAEIIDRPLCKEKMEEAGYWKYVNIMGDSRFLHWDKNKQINFLFIDSEHSLSDALGEYMKFRVYVPNGGIIGFHDYESCPGVKMAVEIASFLDLFSTMFYSKDNFGVIFMKLIQHDVGGEYLSKEKYLRQKLKENKNE